MPQQHTHKHINIEQIVFYVNANPTEGQVWKSNSSPRMIDIRPRPTPKPRPSFVCYGMFRWWNAMINSNWHTRAICHSEKLTKFPISDVCKAALNKHKQNTSLRRLKTGVLHSTEVAFAFLTQRPGVRILARLFCQDFFRDMLRSWTVAIEPI